MPDLTLLKTKPRPSKPFTARVDDDFVITGTYAFEDLSKADTDQYTARAQDAGLDALIWLLTQLLLSMDLTNDGNPVEITEAGLAVVPRMVLGAMYDAIMEDLNPKAANNTDSTSTTKQAEA